MADDRPAGESTRQLTAILYDDLSAIAHRLRRSERADHTLETSALVHEAFLRLASEQAAAWQSRAHFLAAAANTMRRVLVNYARARNAVKRGADFRTTLVTIPISRIPVMHSMSSCSMTFSNGVGTPSGSGTFTINGNTYTRAQVGTLSTTSKFPGAMPCLGLGFGTPANRGGRVKFLFDLGAAIGKPTVALTSTGAASNATLQADPAGLHRALRALAASLE